MSPELQAIYDLNKSLAASTSALSVQLIEIQAQLGLLIDIERRRMIGEGHNPQEVAQSLEQTFQLHRKAVFETVQARLLLVHPDIDLGTAH